MAAGFAASAGEHDDGLRRPAAWSNEGEQFRWMGATHFLTKTLGRVSTEMSLHVRVYNLKRVMKVLGVVPLMDAIRA